MTNLGTFGLCPENAILHLERQEFEVTDAHCHISCGDANVRELLIGRDFFGVHPWESLGSRVEGLGFRVEGLGFRVEGLGFRVEGLGSREKLATLNSQLTTSPEAGVGEIGLDRLKVRDIPPLMRELFEAQLKLAIELGRPVVLHGAKCWGQVVEEVKRKSEKGKSKDGQTFLFHGFSRSDGLIPDIVALNGFISVGPAVLNDHAVNYRELVKKIPIERLLVETDRTEVCGATRTSPPTGGEAGVDVITAERDAPKRSGGQVAEGDRVATHKRPRETAEGRRPCPSIADVLAKTAELRGMSTAELEAITDRNADMFLGGF